MPDIRPGDIYFVNIKPSQVVGHEQHSRRPFVIVSRYSFNQKSSVIVGLPLTTTKADEHTVHPPHRIQIPANQILRDVSFTGEVRNSLAMTDQVRALDKSRLENRMGSLSDTALAAVGLGLEWLLDDLL